MLTIQLKSEVEKVISSEWRAFSERHPRLAEVIDRDLLIEQAVAAISDDPAFQQSMNEAAAAGIAADLAHIVAGFVKDFLLRMIG